MDYKTTLDDLIQTVIREGGSDIHLSEGRHPTIRVARNLIPLMKHQPLKKEDTIGFLEAMMNKEHLDHFMSNKELDFSYNFHDKARFRGNAYFQQGNISIALRLIPKQIKNLTELGLPEILASFSRRPQGFFLVVGPVGMGKTTTLA